MPAAQAANLTPGTCGSSGSRAGANGETADFSMATSSFSGTPAAAPHPELFPQAAEGKSPPGISSDVPDPALAPQARRSPRGRLQEASSSGHVGRASFVDNDGAGPYLRVARRDRRLQALLRAGFRVFPPQDVPVRAVLATLRDLPPDSSTRGDSTGTLPHAVFRRACSQGVRVGQRPQD